MAQRKGLGRGLGALFGDVAIDPQKMDDEIKIVNGETPAAEKSAKAKTKKAGEAQGKGEEAELSEDAVRYIDVHKLAPNKEQPRKEFDRDKITELAESIRENGMIQPILVRKVENGYEIVAGERRWRAAMEANLPKVPCLVRELTAEQNAVVALIENIQREDLNAIEEAEALNRMLHTYGFTQEQLSKSVGRSRPYIANALRLLKLPKTVRELVSDGTLSAGHAKAILAIEGEEKQLRAASLAMENGWSVRETELFASQTSDAPKKRKARTASKNAEVRRIEEDLKRIFGTKVNLVFGPRKGRIEIEYYSRDELDRLIELLESLK